MIAEMRRVEVSGPRELLDTTLERLQDAGCLHLEVPRARRRLTHPEPSPQERLDLARAEGLVRRLDQVCELLPDAVVAETGDGAAPREEAFAETEEVLAVFAGLEVRRQELLDEERRLRRWSALVDSLEELGESPSRVVIPLLVSDRAIPRGQVAREVEALCRDAQVSLEVAGRDLLGGRRLRVFSVPEGDAALVRRYAWQRGLEEVVLPEEYASLSTKHLGQRIEVRQEQLPGEIRAWEQERDELQERLGPRALALRAQLAEWCARSRARQMAAVTEHAFLLQGWVPARSLGDLEGVIAPLAGDGVSARALLFDPEVHEPPTRMDNPAWARSAEVMLRLFPPPRYGSLDPTMILVFTFPLFFGWMVGDAGYGAVLLLLVAFLHRRLAARYPIARDALRLLGLGAVAGIFFGVLFGEFFGQLGAYLLTGSWETHVHIWMSRGPQHLQEYLGLSLGIGLVHLSLALGFGIWSLAPEALAGDEEAREVLLERVALLIGLYGFLALATGGAVPALAPLGRLVSPDPGLLFRVGGALLVFATAMLAVVLPGARKAVAGLEVVGVLTSLISYARLMAVGCMGVVLADVANRVGRLGAGQGSAGLLLHALGAVALHAAAFVLIVLDPLVNALRLHYVEFFSRFLEPAGTTFAPLRRDPLGSFTPETRPGSSER